MKVVTRNLLHCWSAVWDSLLCQPFEVNQEVYHSAADKRRVLESEVNYMLDNHSAVSSSSSWALSSLFVCNSDGSLQSCNNYHG